MPDGTPVNLRNLFIQDAKALLKFAKTAEYKSLAKKSLDRVWWKWYIVIGIIIILSVIVSVKHDAIIEWMKPGANKLKSLPAGWILGIIIGIVWGLGIGFLILAAGTFLGELATWFAFKGMCTGRAAKFQSQNKYYAALTTLIREKSFLFVLVLRFSAIPGHLTTALSASAGAHFFSYCMAAILVRLPFQNQVESCLLILLWPVEFSSQQQTLPLVHGRKQLSLVYVGTAFGSTNRTTHTVSVITLFLTIIGTGIAAIYIYYQMRIYMICSGLESASSTLVTSPEMAQVPTLNVLQDLEGKLTAAGYPPPYRPRSGTILSGEAAPAYSTIQQQKYERRPFIHPNSSYFENAGGAANAGRSGSRNPSRSRSMGHRAQDDIDVYMGQNRMANQSTTSSRRDSAEPVPYRDDVVQGSKFVIDSAGKSDESRFLTDLATIPHAAFGSTTPPRLSAHLALPGSFEAESSGSTGATTTANRSRSATNASMASNASHLSEQLLLDLGETTPRHSEDDDVEYVRGTSSMDMWRPSSMTLSAIGKQAEAKYEERRRQQERGKRASGREIARDADEYALRKGARRPDIVNRTRGESSAALLGRPTDVE
ncbi:hypothetical protein QFC19_005352 [Naganishia cerealis]|uniref:Uncharacterized protein n=1 Tax=Naganishia cerealis TaxID=610337 RepID=A0ACC2VPA9_9TREE|nr:hypothetical protein QFC19_005352 [Naganishia cerealis]